MPDLISLTNPEDPRLQPYRNQKDAWLRAAHNPDAAPGATATGLAGGRFMAEGALVVEHLLDSAYAVDSVLVSDHRLDALAGLLDRVPPSVPIFAVPRAVAESILGFDLHRGLLACGRRGEPTDPDRLARAASTLVVLEDLTNHDNVGGIFRSAAALAGPDAAVLLSPRCCDPLYRKSLRVSMGCALRLPFATARGWPDDIDRLADAGLTSIALTPDPHAPAIGDLDRASLGRVALLVGAEGPGLSADAISRAALRCRISMHPGVDSLNAAVAAAIALHALAAPADP